MRILILCTGNSCRSQMAHGFLRAFDSRLEVCSAGTSPAEAVNPHAVKVMAEAGIDLSHHTPHSVEEYLGEADREDFREYFMLDKVFQFLLENVADGDTASIVPDDTVIEDATGAEEGSVTEEAQNSAEESETAENQNSEESAE